MYSLTEYRVGSKILSICAIAFVIYGYYLYVRVETVATEIYATRALYGN